MNSNSLEKLIDELNKLPGIGRKSATRIAFHMLNISMQDAIKFSNTILEAKRMQTFPDDYFIEGAWTEAMRQLGNAVPVQLGYIIGKSLIEKL